MSYKKDFHKIQKEYTAKYPESMKMHTYLPDLKNKAILDVGCGSGIDMSIFEKQGTKLIAGLDISKDLITIAKDTAHTADIRNDTFSYISWKDNTFDIVWSKYAINCAEDIYSPLKEMYRVCKKDGLVLLQVTHPIRTMHLLSSQDYFDEGRMIMYPIKNSTLQEPHHTLANWINSITEAGFKIIHCEEILNKPKNEYTGPITPSAIIFVLKK